MLIAANERLPPPGLVGARAVEGWTELHEAGKAGDIRKVLVFWDRPELIHSGKDPTDCRCARRIRRNGR
jgi:hypothetical protein